MNPWDINMLNFGLIKRLIQAEKVRASKESKKPKKLWVGSNATPAWVQGAKDAYKKKLPAKTTPYYLSGYSAQKSEMNKFNEERK